MISFTVPGDPIPWERARTGSGHHVTAPRTRKWQNLVKHHALNAIRPKDRKHAGPVSIRLRFWRQTRRACDWDNLAKSVCDALNGIAYEDDAQIDIALVMRGVDPQFPRVEIEIAPHGPAVLLAPQRPEGRALPEIEP